MNFKRRNFLKLAGLSSLTVLSGKIFAEPQTLLDKDDLTAATAPKQQFNMCGYAAPKMDKVRIGFIGVGNRGESTLDRLPSQRFAIGSRCLRCGPMECDRTVK